jgi:hypothetical protein
MLSSKKIDLLRYFMAGYPSEPQNFIPPLEKNDLFQNNPPFGKVINIMY